MPAGTSVTTATVIKGGAMIASGGVAADIILFHDPMFLYLSLVGAVVSFLGVFYDISHDDTPRNIKTTVTECIKGLVFGAIAIPFWFLLLSSIGSSILQGIISYTINTTNEVVTDPRFEKSLWLIISFSLSWYTIPILNYIVKEVPEIVISKLNKVKKDSK